MKNWQILLKQVITSPKELLDCLELDLNLLPAAERSAALFPLRVPRDFVARMEKGNAQDPLLRQVLPLIQEEVVHPEFSEDPLQENTSNPIQGLLHKYQGRVLLTLSGACAINCRYCFRRHFPYHKNHVGGQAWQTILNYIAADSSITEVIFSGGDPLLVSDDYLTKYFRDLETIPHVNTVRIHSRLPIVLPERVTSNLVTLFSHTRFKIVIVVHCNHANELNKPVQEAMLFLNQPNITLLNQSVLLRGVNDNAACLVQLSRTLFRSGILPYYLHLLDKVQGAAHFEVSEDTAKMLMHTIIQQLPGYLVPKLVREHVGAKSKLPVY